ncbi:MAG: hypothetical protein H6R10_1987 [Rhodocyclaceae bacterium]|nr:hypothetical protein [Rhodocyclaceae bacterium]
MHRLGRAGCLSAKRAGKHGAFLLVWLCIIGPVFALGSDEAQPRFDMISDFGGVGLLQMPTARFAPEGEFSFATGRVSPYFRNAVTMQPLPWAEAVVRYTTIQNRLYGPADFSGDQKYKDRGTDLKLRLHEESAGFPQVALGLRDFGGTGLFSGEYLILSRRYYDLDFTLGIGWGNLGTRGQIANPLGWISSRFKRPRTNNFGQGGTTSGAYFQGERASIIGGISYHTPIPSLTVKLELDGNNYQSEGLNNNQKTASPINVGLTYSYGDWLDFTVGIERGNTLMAQLAFRGNLHKSTGMPKLDEPPEKLKPRDLTADIEEMNRQARSRPKDDVSSSLIQALEAKNYQVDGVLVSCQQATIRVSQNTFRATPRAIGRAARIMANEVPPEVEELTYISLEKGLETNRVTLLRKDLQNAERFDGSTEEIAVNTRIQAPNSLDFQRTSKNRNRYPAFTWNWSPALRQHIGGPDNPYFYQILLRLDSELQITRQLSVSSSLGFNIYNNFADLKLASDSKLPHVRSDIKDYLKQGKNGITRLQADYVTNLGSNWYGRVSGGLFEEMFGGAGSEILYKPFDKRWAVGADINQVRQRGFDERFSFRDYQTTTGHVDLYYHLPFYNTLAQISVGRYLAKDTGVTVDLSRRFDNGSVFGIFATKTNVSAQQFGEGSFDKGFYISIPLDMLSLYSSRSNIGMLWRPLTRDGGQRLNIGKRLYPIVKDSGPDALMRDWDQLLN